VLSDAPNATGVIRDIASIVFDHFSVAVPVGATR
jgi:hypothetical protein